MIRELLCIHSVEDRLVLERTEIDSGFSLKAGLIDDMSFCLIALRLEEDTHDIETLVGRVGNTEIQTDEVLVNPGELAVRIEEILVRRAAADNGKTAGRSTSEGNTSLKVRISVILDGHRSVNHNEMRQPGSHSLDDRYILICIVTTVAEILFNCVSLGSI